MNQKIIFVDIDGTLVGNINHKAFIPETAKIAIQQARENGHLVYLCTGRSKAEIGSEITDIGFDGIIGAAGGYIEVGDKVIFHQCFTQENLEEIETFFETHQISYYLESNTGLYSSQGFLDFLKDEFYGGKVPCTDGFYALLQPLTQCSYEGVNKLSFYSPILSFEELVEALAGKYDLVKSSWGGDIEGTGELSLKGINKATAIHHLISHLNIDIEDTYAIGDSMNDKEMFECVNVAIAMGNALHGVKELADYVTTNVEDDGIYQAFDHFQLLECGN